MFRPEMAEQSLTALSMMDFDGRERLMDRIRQNAARAAAGAQGLPPPAAAGTGQPHAERIGGVAAGEGLAVAAQRRAQLGVRPW